MRGVRGIGFRRNHDKPKKLIGSWKEPFKLAKQITSILDKFSSENGIMPPRPPQFLVGIP
jgi:hypothetical protein